MSTSIVFQWKTSPPDRRTVGNGYITASWPKTSKCPSMCVCVCLIWCPTYSQAIGVILHYWLIRQASTTSPPSYLLHLSLRCCPHLHSTDGCLHQAWPLVVVQQHLVFLCLWLGGSACEKMMPSTFIFNCTCSVYTCSELNAIILEYIVFEIKDTHAKCSWSQMLNLDFSWGEDALFRN